MEQVCSALNLLSLEWQESQRGTHAPPAQAGHHRLPPAAEPSRTRVPPETPPAKKAA